MFAKNEKFPMFRIVLALILVAGFFDVTNATADVTVRYVKWDATGANDGSSWTDAYTDLQSALSAASAGDEIWVAAGTYKPTSGTDRTVSFVLKNGVAVYGGFAGNETSRDQRNPTTNVTILSGDIGTADDISDNSYHVVVSSNTDNSTLLDGFTITGGNANASPTSSEYFYGGGMYNDMGSPRLNNLIFTNNHAGFGGGLYSQCAVNGCAVDLTLTNTVFSNNSVMTEGGGIATQFSTPPLSASHRLSLTNVTLINNTAGRAGGGISNRGGGVDVHERDL